MTLGQPPPTVTAENGYTYFDLSTIAGFERIATLGVRMILASETFPCSATQVPHSTSEDHSLGGFMGEYAPAVDAIRGSLIPPVAAPPGHPNSCGLVPPGPPVDGEFPIVLQTLLNEPAFL
jgi:hypothetical protein